MIITFKIGVESKRLLVFIDILDKDLLAFLCSENISLYFKPKSWVYRTIFRYYLENKWV